MMRAASCIVLTLFLATGALRAQFEPPHILIMRDSEHGLYLPAAGPAGGLAPDSARWQLILDNMEDGIGHPGEDGAPLFGDSLLATGLLRDARWGGLQAPWQLPIMGQDLLDRPLYLRLFERDSLTLNTRYWQSGLSSIQAGEGVTDLFFYPPSSGGRMHRYISGDMFESSMAEETGLNPGAPETALDLPWSSEVHFVNEAGEGTGLTRFRWANWPGDPPDWPYGGPSLYGPLYLFAHFPSGIPAGVRATCEFLIPEGRMAEVYGDAFEPSEMRLYRQEGFSWSVIDTVEATQQEGQWVLVIEPPAEQVAAPWALAPAVFAEQAPGETPLPEAFTFRPPYPNPFNSTAFIELEIPFWADTRIEIHNLLGQRVTTLHDGRLLGGRHTFTFRADGLASGVYFVRVLHGSRWHLRKLLLLR